MQPAWREGESLVKTVPNDVDWEPILRGGSNGFSVVVMALSWWIDAVKSNIKDNSDLSMAVEDVKWVLSELVAVLSVASVETGKKHPCESTTEEGPDLKRCVLFDSGLADRNN